MGDDDLCATCHEEVVQAFGATTHGRLREHEVHKLGHGCTACHGDGAAHADAGGDTELIAGLGATTAPEEIWEVCTAGRRSESLHSWPGSAHELNGVSCTDCHNPHRLAANKEREVDVCLPCHTEVQAQMDYPARHPVREGNMSCASCHTPHGSSIGLVKNQENLAQLCLSCHTQYQGPFILEHEPVFEGCDTCHLPHGSVADNLLAQNEPSSACSVTSSTSTPAWRATTRTRVISPDDKRVDNDQQSGDLRWDAKRVFLADVSYDSFIHRLTHDPPLNLNVVSEVKVTRSTDFEPDENYQSRYQVMDANFGHRPSSVSWLSFRADVRGQKRTGRRQHLSMGHCTSCHVTAQGREVDETIQDAKLGAHVRAGIWDFDVEVMKRDYKDEGANPTMFFEQAIHPATVTTPFDDRVWFQNGNEDTLQVPDITRQTGQFKMRGSFGGGSVFNFAALGSKTKNDFTDLEMSFEG